MDNLKINILGTEWEVKYQSLKENDKLDDSIGGLCDNSSKSIVVRRFEEGEYDVLNIKNYEKHCLKHEIVHAYLFECGLEENSLYTHAWAVNEEMVDWIAHQCHKIEKTHIEVCASLFEEHGGIIMVDQLGKKPMSLKEFNKQQQAKRQTLTV